MLFRSDQNSNYIKANWIVILITLGSFVTYFAVIQERRLIFHLIPFFIIFAIIPIQRLIEYGLSTFSFSQKQKNYSLVIVLSVALLLAITFTLRYDLPDTTKEQEKIELAKYLLSKHEGKVLDTGNALEGLMYAKIESSSNNFKNYMIKNDLDAKNEKIQTISLYAKSMTDFITVAEQHDLKYVIIKSEEHTSELQSH